MTKTIAHTYDIAFEYRSKITAAVLLICALLAAYYAFGLYGVITKTMAIQKTDRGIASLSSSVSGLDSAYLDLSGTVTPDVLAQYGLQAGHVTAYIDRTAPTASLGGLARAGHEL